MEALKELLFKMADDELILGHRNSEWTGLGPILEEDIAFSSMAQDKIGHAWAIYQILHNQLGEKDPDSLAFQRDAKDFRSCQFGGLPNGEFDFSLARQFLFDHAEKMRYEMLAASSFQPLANLAKKIKGELKYHVMHNDSWMLQLGNGTEESKARMQTAMNEAFPFARGIFENGNFEEELMSNGIFQGEEELKTKWYQSIETVLEKSNLKIPDINGLAPENGGRHGYHSEHLQPLLNEMCEVVNADPEAVGW